MPLEHICAGRMLLLSEPASSLPSDGAVFSSMFGRQASRRSTADGFAIWCDDKFASKSVLKRLVPVTSLQQAYG
jgi:hypothetical protein